MASTVTQTGADHIGRHDTDHRLYQFLYDQSLDQNRHFLDRYRGGDRHGVVFYAAAIRHIYVHGYLTDQRVEQPGRLDSWSAHVIRVGRSPVVILTNDAASILRRHHELCLDGGRQLNLAFVQGELNNMPYKAIRYARPKDVLARLLAADL